MNYAHLWSRKTTFRSLIPLAGVICMLLLALAGSPAAVASTCPINSASPNAEFSVNAYVYGYSGIPVCGTSGELPIEATTVGGGQHYMETSLRIERPGEILQDVYATGNGYGSNRTIVHSAFMHLGDVVISGGPAPTVNGTLNLFYGGDQIACAATNCYGGSEFWVRVNGGGYNTFDYVWGVYETGSVPLANLPVGTAFNLTLEFRGAHAALAFTGGSQTWDGFLQFLSSQVMTLPEGYTVNSAEGLIVDNQWAVAVPVPAAGWLLGSALGALGWLSRVRKRDRRAA